MECQAPDTPINAIVQTLFVAGEAPGLRALTQLVHKVYGRARTSILPSGARYDLQGTGVLEVSCDLVTERHSMAILTFTLTPADETRPDTESERLDWQNRTLDRLVQQLDPAQTHWHMLPGPIGRIAARRLARRSLELLSRRVWTAKADVADPGPTSRAAWRPRAHRGAVVSTAAASLIPDRPDTPRPIVSPANDLPALPAPCLDRVDMVQRVLAVDATEGVSVRLSMQVGSRGAVVIASRRGYC